MMGKNKFYMNKYFNFTRKKRNVNSDEFLKVNHLKTLSTNADDFIVHRNIEDELLFDKVFLKDEFYKHISNPNTYFIIGEKGSGKTAYAVYFCKNSKVGISELDRIPKELFYKFIGMKENGLLNSTPYHEIWENVISMMILSYLKKDMESRFYKNIINRNKIRLISDFIERFNSKSFEPNFQSVLEIVESYSETLHSDVSSRLGYNNEISGKIAGGLENSKSENKKIERISMTLTDLLNQSKNIFEKINYKKPINFFIDGIDILPENIDYNTYKQCIEGLANAIVHLNGDKFFRKNGIRVCLLIRPDLLFDMKIYNGGQSLANNSVYLKWDVADKNYKTSLLYKIADNYLSKQQEKPIMRLGKSWKHYFPYSYKPYRDSQEQNSFIQFLTFSNYKPRDILTLLNLIIRQNANSETKVSFTKKDIHRIREQYHAYLKNELKDYMSVYITLDEFKMFDLFLKNLNKLGIRKKFTYDEFFPLIINLKLKILIF